MARIERVVLRFDASEVARRSSMDFPAIDQTLSQFPHLQTVTLESSHNDVDTSLASKFPLLRDNQRLQLRTLKDSCAVSLAAKRWPDEIRDGYPISAIWNDDDSRRRW